jgi:hypothetical protein
VQNLIVLMGKLETQDRVTVQVQSPLLAESLLAQRRPVFALFFFFFLVELHLLYFAYFNFRAK